MKRKYIVVTGGAGFIGSHLIEIILKRTKINVISLDNYSSGSNKNHIKSQRVKYLKGETKDIFKILKNFKKQITDLFHLGEFSRIAESFIQTDKCFDSNILGTLNVLNFCKKNNIKIIYSATSSAFDEKENLSPYSFSKFQNVKLIKNYNKWFNLKFKIFYFYNVYGERQISTGNMAAVIGIFEKRYKRKKYLPVVRPGNQKRNFTYVKDIVNACYIGWKKGVHKEYLLRSEKEYTIYEVAKMFSKKINLVKSRPGERFKSNYPKEIKTNINLGLKFKNDLKDYINKFKSK